MVAVQLHGTHTDLKNIIQQSGMKLNMTDMNPGEPNDETFVKQVFKSVVELIPLYLKIQIYFLFMILITIIYFKAKYHMKKYNYETALKYVYVALEYNPESLVRRISKFFFLVHVFAMILLITNH